MKHCKKCRQSKQALAGIIMLCYKSVSGPASEEEAIKEICKVVDTVLEKPELDDLLKDYGPSLFVTFEEILKHIREKN